jgi:hypothetical protein
MRANTDWFHDAKWGVFVHYLADVASCVEVPDVSVDDWNRRIDGFDVPALADQLEEIGAGYYYITLGQNSGFYLSPNPTYDAIVVHSPSHCSQRDLVADLIAELAPRGVRVMVYFTSGAPALDRQAIEALKCTPPWDANLLGFHPELYTAVPGVDERMSEFQRMWESVIRDWSLRWGKDCHGWWFDGAYQADRMYRNPDEPNFASFAAAAKAGNPDSLVAFNPGVILPVICHTEYEDYTAGEISNTLPTNGAEPCVIPVGRWVKGAQYHILTFLGGCWCHPVPRFTDAMVAAYTRYVNSWEGVVTWDHPVTPDGQIPDAILRQLAGIRA